MCMLGWAIRGGRVTMAEDNKLNGNVDLLAQAIARSWRRVSPVLQLLPIRLVHPPLP